MVNTIEALCQHLIAFAEANCNHKFTFYRVFSTHIQIYTHSPGSGLISISDARILFFGARIRVGDELIGPNLSDQSIEWTDCDLINKINNWIMRMDQLSIRAD